MPKEVNQLAAVMFTDIVGYSSIMGKNRQQALDLLDQNRECQKPIIEKHGGKYIKELGDGILATFPTASEAVFCAIEIQQALQNDPELKVRIALHLGEVIFSGEDVFGDGVNVASRMERIAPPQGIYLSESVFREIRNITEIKTKFLGDIKFKNVDEPVRIYSIIMDFLPLPSRSYFHKKKEELTSPFSKTRVAFALVAILIIAFVSFYFIQKGSSPQSSFPDKSIAVLPFENLSKDSSTNYFSVGITDEILVQLSRINELRVIDRSNFRNYSYQDKSYLKIGEDLHAANILTGRIQRSDDKVRVSVRLIKLPSEEQLWAENFDRSFRDIFKIQSDIARKVAGSLQARISSSEAKSLKSLPTLNTTAYDLYLKGKEYYNRYTMQDNLSAIELFKRALSLDPEFTLAHAGLSDAFSQVAMRSNARDIWLDSAYYHASIVKRNAPGISNGYKSMGLYYSIKGNTRPAIREFEKAIEIDNNIEAVINLSRLYYRSGQLNEALRVLNNNQWSQPMNADLWFSFGAVYYRFNEFSMAVDYLDKALTINPNHVNSLLLKWWMATLLEQNEVAHSLASKLGFVGEDNLEMILSILMNVIQQEELNWNESAITIKNLMEGREADYIDLPYLFNLIGYVYHEGGLRDQSGKLLDQKVRENLNRISNGDLSYKNPYELAQIHGLRGEKNEAYEWLEKSLQAGNTEYVFAFRDPTLKHLRDEEHFHNWINGVMNKVDSLKRITTDVRESQL